MPPPPDAALLAVVGMQREAALLPPGLRVLVTGGDPLHAAALLAAEPASGIAAVLSFGIAGGLDPSLACGDLVVSTRVRGPGGAWPAHPGWAADLARATGARLGGIAGAAAIVAEPAAKRALQLATGALVVDLESEAAAAFASARGLPFVALRAVADTAADRLPDAVARGLTPDGRPALLRIAAGLLRDPRALREMPRLARQARTALAALRRATAALPGRWI